MPELTITDQWDNDVSHYLKTQVSKDLMKQYILAHDGATLYMVNYYANFYEINDEMSNINELITIKDTHEYIALKDCIPVKISELTFFDGDSDKDIWQQWIQWEEQGKVKQATIGIDSAT